jgi:hypothetical protein
VSIPASVMSSPDFSTDPHRDLIRRIIEARAAYERLSGQAPTLIYVNGPIKLALEGKGLQEGSEVAGLKIVASPESVADQAICSRDHDLFKPAAAQKPARAGKSRTAA